MWHVRFCRQCWWVFWVTIPCRMVRSCRVCGTVCCLQLQGPRNSLLWITWTLKMEQWSPSKTLATIIWQEIIRGSFQEFCTLNVFYLKMNLFYKIHLQAFNVISIVLYHRCSKFGKVLYSCLDAFVVDVSDYSGHLIRHLLNASEAFLTEWFLQFWEQVKIWWAQWPE
jgi:hypothetical protein